jgi:transcription antitermination factor NusG
MPLLPAEPVCYPPDLMERPDASEDGTWWVLHTKPRAEKAIARSLYRDEVPFFLPIYELSKRVGRRVQTSHLPLFPGYLFLRAGESGRIKALETNQVAHCIAVTDQEQLRSELEAIQRVMSSGAPIGPETRLIPGTPVTIARGPLTGLKGKVLHRGSRLTLVLEVHMLSQGVAVEIEGWMVEAIPPESQEEK